jgi:glycosyltransferase involved in cell wall biosynthesis
LDAFVQIWTNYDATGIGTPSATFDDMTIVQAVAAGYPEWGALSAKSLRHAIERQRRVYELSTVCCVTTTWAAQSLVDDYRIPRSKVHVVGVGRNVNPSARSRDWESPRFLFVGADWHRKNGERVLEAFRRVRQQVPSATLDIVGRHRPIRAPNVSDHGSLDLSEAADLHRLERLFEDASCLVVPSLHDPSALVYVEAAAAGIPAIGTIKGGSRELIGEGGLVVDPTDDEAILRAMLALSDPITAARLGAIARARSERFTWPEVAARIVAGLGLNPPNAEK